MEFSKQVNVFWVLRCELFDLMFSTVPCILRQFCDTHTKKSRTELSSDSRKESVVNF